jgi:hypothetical protein
VHIGINSSLFDFLLRLLENVGEIEEIEGRENLLLA